ncbi:MAG: hypothetical protein ABI373_04505, partial [Flavobacteriales bacterium]
HLIFDDGSGAVQNAVIDVFSATGQRVTSEHVTFSGPLDHVMHIPTGVAAGLYMIVFTTADRREMRMIAQP